MAPRIPTVPVPGPDDLLARIQRDVQRNALRARNGIRLIRGTSRPKVGQTPHGVIWQRGRARLLRYRSDYIRWRPPLLLVYSLVAPCQW